MIFVLRNDLGETCCCIIIIIIIVVSFSFLFSFFFLPQFFEEESSLEEIIRGEIFFLFFLIRFSYLEIYKVLGKGILVLLVLFSLLWRMFKEFFCGFFFFSFQKEEN